MEQENKFTKFEKENYELKEKLKFFVEKLNEKEQFFENRETELFIKNKEEISNVENLLKKTFEAEKRDILIRLAGKHECEMNNLNSHFQIKMENLKNYYEKIISVEKNKKIQIFKSENDHLNYETIDKLKKELCEEKKQNLTERNKLHQELDSPNDLLEKLKWQNKLGIKKDPLNIRNSPKEKEQSETFDTQKFKSKENLNRSLKTECSSLRNISKEEKKEQEKLINELTKEIKKEKQANEELMEEFQAISFREFSMKEEISNQSEQLSMSLLQNALFKSEIIRLTRSGGF